MCCCIIETLLVPGNLRQFSENGRKMYGKVRLASGTVLVNLRKNFGKWSEIFRKSSKTSLLVCLYTEQGQVSRKPQKGFRAHKAIFRTSVSKNGEVYTPETFFCMKGTSLNLNNM